MTFSEPLSQYEEILKNAIRTSMKESGAKLAKTFQTLLIEIRTIDPYKRFNSPCPAVFHVYFDFAGLKE